MLTNEVPTTHQGATEAAAAAALLWLKNRKDCDDVDMDGVAEGDTDVGGTPAEDAVVRGTPAEDTAAEDAVVQGTAAEDTAAAGSVAERASATRSVLLSMAQCCLPEGRDAIFVRSPLEEQRPDQRFWTAHVMQCLRHTSVVEPSLGIRCSAVPSSGSSDASRKFFWYVTDPEGRYAQIIVIANKFVCVLDAARRTVWVLLLPAAPTAPPTLLGGISASPDTHFANLVGICALPVAAADASEPLPTFRLATAQSMAPESAAAGAAAGAASGYTLLRVIDVYVNPAGATAVARVRVHMKNVFGIPIPRAGQLAFIRGPSSSQKWIGVADRSRGCVAVYEPTGEARGVFFALLRGRPIAPVSVTQLHDGRLVIVTECGIVAYCTNKKPTPFLTLVHKDRIGVIRTVQTLVYGSASVSILTTADGVSYGLTHASKPLHFPTQNTFKARVSHLLRESECEEVPI